MQNHKKNWIGFFVGLFAVLLGPWSRALMTITPKNGGTLSASSPTTNTFYYFVNWSGTEFVTGGTNPTLGTNAFVDFTPIDINKSGVDNSQGIFEFDVNSNLSFTPGVGQVAVITVTAYNVSSSPFRPVPIASVDGTLCSVGSSACLGRGIAYQSPGQDPYGSNLFTAARYPAPNATTRVGISLADLCAKLGNGLGAEGCDLARIKGPPGGTGADAVTNFRLNFTISLSSSEANVIPTPSPSIDSNAQPITLTLQTDYPTLSCPSTDKLSSPDLWSPGDKKVYLNANLFTHDSSGSSAPEKYLVVVGNYGGKSADNSSSFKNNNSLKAWISAGQERQVVGSGDNKMVNYETYEFKFLTQDEAGVYGIPTGSCTAPRVQSGEINGPLVKDMCFIATATYRSEHAFPIEVLRKFRDRVLLRHPLGTQFVNFYYKHAPVYADWLYHHPNWRYLCLLALTPIEFFAWISLYPTLASSLLLIAMAMIATSMVSFLRRETGSK